MAVSIAQIVLIPVDTMGNVVNKNTATIKDMMTASSEHRVAPNPYNTNSNNYPTIEEYIVLEDAAGRKLAHMDQYKIITQS